MFGVVCNLETEIVGWKPFKRDPRLKLQTTSIVLFFISFFLLSSSWLSHFILSTHSFLHFPPITEYKFEYAFLHHNSGPLGFKRYCLSDYKG
ncbi:hypothetical protein BT96DRAFT_561691 [Gymnopus androsaceus JB14]|uniref:Uncharacterized protein n=1 Tax=Gymnopus androsaceus JB14 TaxID=1447944 RepID=A0A6A4GKW2_9AGAR|nr:hypothetical protein BT96DRAFT_561691 [Gymnopus androsaceus JB14]